MEHDRSKECLLARASLAILAIMLIVWGVFRLSSREKGEAADIVSVSQYAEVQRYAAGQFWIPEVDEWAENTFHASLSWSDVSDEVLMHISFDGLLTDGRSLMYAASAQEVYAPAVKQEVRTAQYGSREVRYALMGDANDAGVSVWFDEDGVSYTLGVLYPGATHSEDEKLAEWLLALCAPEK